MPLKRTGTTHTQAVQLADGVTVARDGTVYFTDASVVPTSQPLQGGEPGRIEFEMVDAVLESVLRGPSGRLLRYSPATGETTVLMKALWFANGVALSADESFVVVAASVSNRVHRFWLRGPLVHAPL
jgi:sugar lactone lactonase YvrE